MKAFIVILLLAALGVGVWILWDKGHLDPVMEKLAGRTSQTAPAEPAGSTAPSVSDIPANTTPPTPSTPPQTMPPSEGAAPPLTEADREIAERYPMPDIKPLEEIVDNWNTVPERAFPETVTVDVNVEYKLFLDGREIGSSKDVPGHKAKPISQKGDQLLVTNRPDGTTRAVVKVEDTDFKEQIQARYDEFVAKTRQKVLSARERAQQTLAAGGPSAAPADTAGVDPKFAPVRQYLAEGKLNSGLLEEVTGWNYIGNETHGGQSYEVVQVDFLVDTIFGKFPNTMKCLLQNGRVVKWLDADSNEERT